jgi:DNA processing protein
LQHNLDEIRYSLALKSLKGVGNISAIKLLSSFHTATALFTAPADELRAAGIKQAIIEQIQRFDLTAIEPLLAWLEKTQRFIIPLGSPYYPPLLSQIHNPPLLLFVLGNPELLLSPQIGVVGSRNPTAQGIANTQSLCQALCEQGLTITSGLAMGIDGEAHRAALANQGYTVAVTGTGLDRVYPPGHRQLAHQIAASGALVSEHLPHESQHGGSFSQRNRIIAGLSLGTLVIEAAAKSGTLITARCAMEEGREVYAVPGSIHSPLSKGCHALIKQGAKLVESIEDIMEDFPQLGRAMVAHSTKSENPPLDEESARFLQFIDYELTSLDTIVARSQLTVEAVTNKLLTLELEGWVINSVGGYIRQ